MRLRTVSASILISASTFALTSCGSTNDRSSSEGDTGGAAASPSSGGADGMAALAGSGGADSSSVAGSEGVIDIGGLDGSGAGGSSANSGGTSEDHPSTDVDWSNGLTSGPNGPIPVIVVDQFGYRTGATKVAVLRDPQVGYDDAVDAIAFPAGSRANSTVIDHAELRPPAACVAEAANLSAGGPLPWRRPARSRWGVR